MRYYEIVHTESVAVIAAMNSNHYVGDLYVIVTDIIHNAECKRVSFYPRPVLAFGYCRCLRLSVSLSVTKFVRAITHYPFKLG